jgi:hypothetical protein
LAVINRPGFEEIRDGRLHRAPFSDYTWLDRDGNYGRSGVDVRYWLRYRQPATQKRRQARVPSNATDVADGFV